MVFNIKWEVLKKNPLPKEVDSRLGLLLTKIDDYCGHKLYVHRMYDPTPSTSQHHFGRAADVHIEGMHVLDQYVLVERFTPAGLGVYPKDVWKYTPGLHIDVRPTDIGKRWGYIGDGKGGRTMVAIGRDFFKHIIELDSSQNSILIIPPRD